MKTSTKNGWPGDNSRSADHILFGLATLSLLKLLLLPVTEFLWHWSKLLMAQTLQQAKNHHNRRIDRYFRS